MRTEDIESAPPSAWIPETNPITIAVLGKTQEELSELSGELMRALIQGIDATNPTNGNINRNNLANELDDAENMINIIREHYGIGPNEIRRQRKWTYQRRWHEMLRIKYNLKDIYHA